jgi:2-polyprenyl-3-methyl-5-hydroxy-6-metoxy-1,4-benzoquinol methylase
MANSWGIKTPVPETPTPEDVARFWTANAPHWNQSYGELGDPLREALLPLDNLLAWLGPHAQRLIDAGCGAGYLSRLLAGAGRDVLGVDSSAGQIGLAREITGKATSDIVSRCAFVQASLTDLSELKPLGQYDGAVCITVLENVEDFQSALQQLSDRLRPRSRLVLAVIHPCFSMRDLRVVRSPARPDDVDFWAVDNYAARGVSSVTYPGMLQPIYTFHRTLEDYAVGLARAGFIIEGLHEPLPTEDQIDQHPNSLRSRGRRIPRLLVIVAAKLTAPHHVS